MDENTTMNPEMEAEMPAVEMNDEAVAEAPVAEEGAEMVAPEEEAAA